MAKESNSPAKGVSNTRRIEGEDSRTYHFPDGSQTKLIGVSSISVSKSGRHYLETSDGEKHIMRLDWNRISIKAKSWSHGPSS